MNISSAAVLLPLSYSSADTPISAAFARLMPPFSHYFLRFTLPPRCL